MTQPYFEHHDRHDRRLPVEQAAYARWLRVGMAVCMAVMVATFAVYVLGLRNPHVPVDQLPRSWTLPSREFLQQHRVTSGWGWIGHVGDGDYLNLIGLALLAVVTPLCYLRVLVVFVRKRDYAYAAIAAITILITALAAAGVFGAGGH